MLLGSALPSWMKESVRRAYIQCNLTLLGWQAERTSIVSEQEALTRLERHCSFDSHLEQDSTTGPGTGKCPGAVVLFGEKCYLFSCINRTSLMLRLILTTSLLVGVMLLSCCSPDRHRSGPVLQFDMKQLASSFGERDTAHAPLVAVRFLFPELRKVVASPLRDSLQRYISEMIFGSLTNGAGPVPFDTIANGIFEEYRMLQEEFSDYSLPWSLEREMRVETDTASIVSLRFREYSFLGGAHGMEIVKLASFDAVTGKRLGLADLFTAGSDSTLSGLVEQRFRESRGIPQGESLQDAGFWMEDGKFAVGTNVAVGNGEMIFYYNAYEIAPYALGPTEVRIPFTKLSSILSKEKVLIDRR